MLRDRIPPLLDLTRRGLEIGALDRPIVTRRMGPVEYVDHEARADLQAAYSGHPAVRLEALVEVDHVWGARSLLECVGGRREFGWVVASHVIEHVPDLFGWLREIASVLADDGLAAFIVPDKRYTFDLLRRTSSGAELVDAHVRGLRRPDARQVYDHLTGARALGDGGAMAPALTDQQEREVLELCQRSQAGGLYVDVHCWVFTPRTLVEALALGSRLGLLPYAIERLEPTAEGATEFLLVLRRLPEGLDAAARREAFAASVAGLALPAETAAAHEDIAVLAAQVQIARARVAAIEASTSWRLTAPLRALATWLGGGRRV